MAAIKHKPIVQLEPPLIRAGKYLLLAYWVLCAGIYLTVDLFIDLYTTDDFTSALWYAVIISLPVTAVTLYYLRKEVAARWYTYILYPAITFGLYLGCTYFNVLNADLLLSGAFRPCTEQVMPIEHIQQVIARKIGFIHTDITLEFQGKPVTFQGTRTSFFLLNGKKEVRAEVGQSYLGNLYAVRLQIPARKRWLARGAYISNWFHRYLWVLIGIPLLFILGLLKDRFFSKPMLSPAFSSRFRKFSDILLLVILSATGLIVLVLVLAYLVL